MIKRFLVFAGDIYYPGGGWDDFKDSFLTEAAARTFIDDNLGGADWWQIVDSESGIVKSEVRHFV